VIDKRSLGQRRECATRRKADWQKKGIFGVHGERKGPGSLGARLKAGSSEEEEEEEEDPVVVALSGDAGLPSPLAVPGA